MLNMRRHWLWSAGAIAIAAVAATWAMLRADARAVPAELRAVIATDPVRLEPLQLNDQQGRPVSQAWFNGRWSFVFFGFTHCPNICPATLAQLREIQKAFASGYPGAAPPRYVFVSVDPGRDTPARIQAYLAGFDAGFIGLTGERGQIEAMEKPFAAFHRLGAPSATGDYQVQHSGEIFLVDPAGRVYARFQPPVDPALVARQLDAIMTFYAREAAQTSTAGA